MKTISKILLVILFISTQTNLFAQTEAEQKAWMEYMTPGPVHEMLAKSDGDWTEDITMWMAPGGPPTKMTAAANNKMILGGRYQYSTHNGNMLGMPFEGISTIGYDNGKKVFISSWIDNMGTGMMNLEGTWDDANKTVNFKGKSFDPLTGKDMGIRETFKIIDDNHQLMEMFMSKDGNEFKTMEIVLTKK